MSLSLRPRYVLGCVVQGCEFLFTELPTFRSVLEAADYWRSKPRVGVAYVFEERDVSRLGVVYGLAREIVATLPVVTSPEPAATTLAAPLGAEQAQAPASQKRPRRRDRRRPCPDCGMRVGICLDLGGCQS